MDTQEKSFQGYYSFEDGKFIPQGEMSTILAMIDKMSLLQDKGLCNHGSFYYDFTTSEYWHYIQFEDYRTVLQKIERSEIEAKHPSVDCNSFLKK